MPRAAPASHTPDVGAPSVVLAGAAGVYREYKPAAALARHFRRVWFNTLSPDRGAYFAVVPDGCVDLTWIDGEIIVAGPDIAVSIAPITPGRDVIGVRFRPGAARIWLGLSMSEIVGARVPLDGFWGARARAIGQRVGDATSTAERMNVFQASLLRLAANHRYAPQDLAFVFHAMKTDSTGRGMSLILDRLGMSPRTLRRRCVDAFGYGPKMLDRILRFQRFLRLATRTPAPRLAALAFAAGYADQAHLTREVRRLSGFSPGEMLTQLRRAT